MSKLKDKLKASISPEASKSEAGKKQDIQEKESPPSVQAAQVAADTKPVVKKAVTSVSVKGLSIQDKLSAASHYCSVWPD